MRTFVRECTLRPCIGRQRPRCDARKTRHLYGRHEPPWENFIVYDDATAGPAPHHHHGARIVGRGPASLARRAKKLAEQGYTAFMAKARTVTPRPPTIPEDAGALATSVMKAPPKVKSTASRPLNSNSPSVPGSNPRKDPRAVGYCFGGAVVLNMARDRRQPRGGCGLSRLARPQRPGKSGRDRQGKGPHPQRRGRSLQEAGCPTMRLKKDFDAAKANYRIIEYPGAVRAFTDPEATALGEKFNLPRLTATPRSARRSEGRADKFFAAFPP